MKTRYALCLILIGYDCEQVKKAIAENAFGTDKVVLLKGEHDLKGNEAYPLDITVAKPIIKELLADIKELHPIETILSGPVASVIGARHLAGKSIKGRPSWVVDIGGTTTDIIYLNEKGETEISSNGATVGKYQTLIKTVDIYVIRLVLVEIVESLLERVGWLM